MTRAEGKPRRNRTREDRGPSDMSPATKTGPETSEQIDGAKPLDKVERYLTGFGVYSSEEEQTVAVLWPPHTHAMHEFRTTPRLLIDAPSWGSGKSTVAETLALVSQAWPGSTSATPAGLRRYVDEQRAEGLLVPTMVLDEMDEKLRSGEGTAVLLDLVNEGFSPRGKKLMGDGDNLTKPKVFSGFFPVILVGIDFVGRLRGPLRSRSVVINLRPGEPRRNLDREHKKAVREAAALRASLACWMAVASERPDFLDVDMPPGLTARQQQVWLPLFAVAQAASGAWPARAEAACRAYVAQAKPRTSIEDQLRTDLLRVMSDRRVPSEDVVSALNALPGAPWSTYNGGTPLRQTQLGHMTRKLLGVRPKSINGRKRGYYCEDIEQVTTSGRTTSTRDKYIRVEASSTSRSVISAGQQVAGKSRNVIDTPRSVIERPTSVIVRRGSVIETTSVADDHHDKDEDQVMYDKSDDDVRHAKAVAQRERRAKSTRRTTRVRITRTPVDPSAPDISTTDDEDAAVGQVEPEEIECSPVVTGHELNAIGLDDEEDEDDDEEIDPTEDKRVYDKFGGDPERPYEDAKISPRQARGFSGAIQRHAARLQRTTTTTTRHLSLVQ